MKKQAPIFKPENDWENVTNWIKKDDAARTTLMRNAIREEFSAGFKPITNRLANLTIAVIIFVGLGLGAGVYFFVKIAMLS